MPTVLLRVAGLNAFNADAEAQPPQGELAQIKLSVSGSERHAVITGTLQEDAAAACAAI